LKTINGIVGSILVILGVAALAGLVIVGAGTCTENKALSALLHVPTCDQTTATIFVLLLVGIIFLIVGAVVLFKGRQKQATVPKALAPEAEPSRTPPAMPVIYCRQCGKQMPSGSLYCNQCGTRL